MSDRAEMSLHRTDRVSKGWVDILEEQVVAIGGFVDIALVVWKKTHVRRGTETAKAVGEYIYMEIVVKLDVYRMVYVFVLYSN